MPETKIRPDAKIQNEHYEDVSLVLSEGTSKGKRFRLRDGRNVLGRAGDVVLDGEGVSRQHAAITVGEDIRIEDLGSTTGTVLNSRLLVGEDFLFDSDELRIGPFTLRLSAERKEGKTGFRLAVAAVAAGLLILVIALALREVLTAAWNKPFATVATIEKEVAWQDWNNFLLPTEAELQAEGILIGWSSAMNEFDSGERLSRDRRLSPGNAYGALLHHKRCLAILSLLPPDERPGVAGRSTDALADLRQSIEKELRMRAFAYVQAYNMRHWAGAREALEAIMLMSPQEKETYHSWAKGQTRRLDAAGIRR